MLDNVEEHDCLKDFLVEQILRLRQVLHWMAKMPEDRMLVLRIAVGIWLFLGRVM